MSNYQDLKGKEIKVIAPDGEIDYAFIAEIKEKKGITIMGTFKGETEIQEVYCLNVKHCVDFKKQFKWLIKYIKRGEIDWRKDPFFNQYAFESSSPCIFK